MRIPTIIAAALAVVAGSAPAVADEPSAPERAVQASSCYIPQLIAHRGGGGVGADPYYQENSWPAFENSVRLGVKTLETDVRWTVDNVAIIMHDDALERTTNGTGLVSTSTYDYIKTLELKNGAGKIPLFKEMLEYAKANNVAVWPEYKPEKPNQTWVDEYARIMNEVGGQAVVPSFLKPELTQFKTLLPQYSQIWFQDPLSGFSVKPSDVPTGAWAGIINVVLTEAIAEEMKKAKIPVYAWYNLLTRGDDPAGWVKMARLNPVGIITDYPEAYEQWAQGTTYCAKPKAKCAKLPKKLPADDAVVLLKRTCKTSAGTKVKVTLKGKKSAGKLKKGANGKVSVVTGKKGKLTISYNADGSNTAGPLTMSKKYTVK